MVQTPFFWSIIGVIQLQFLIFQAANYGGRVYVNSLKPTSS